MKTKEHKFECINCGAKSTVLTDMWIDKKDKECFVCGYPLKYKKPKND